MKQTWAKREEVEETATPVGLTQSKLLIRNFFVGNFTSGNATTFLFEFFFWRGEGLLLTWFSLIIVVLSGIFIPTVFMFAQNKRNTRLCSPFVTKYVVLLFYFLWLFLLIIYAKPKLYGFKYHYAIFAQNRDELAWNDCFFTSTRWTTLRWS